MIDTHCHLLFGLDDGPRSPAETLSLARQQVAVGVTHVVCTPHFSRTFPTPLEQARERLAATRDLLIGAGIALELGLAAELSPGTSISEPIQALTERAIAGRFALVEMEPDTPAAFAAAVTERLRAKGWAWCSRIRSAVAACSGRLRRSTGPERQGPSSRSSLRAWPAAGVEESRPPPGSSWSAPAST